MTRPGILLAGVLVGIAGIFTHYALPWTASDSSGDIEHFSYMEFAESGFGSFARGDGASPTVLGLTLVLQGFYWGVGLLALAYLGVLVRGTSAALATAFALLGATSVVVTTAFFAVGGTLFFTALRELSADAAAFANIGYSINYGTPILAGVLVTICGAHAVGAIGEARSMTEAARAASASAPYVPQARPDAVAAASAARPVTTPAPAPSVAPAAPALAPTRAPPPASPLERERQRAMERIAQARDHARGIARGTDDPAMASWLRQTEAYLNALVIRVRDAKDAETLAGVERDVEQHVLRHG